jgi:curved DNA-binding protein CbpA
MAADHFATLRVPRQPWLDEQVLRASFQRLAGETHPDAEEGDNERFVALNEAWQTLRSPARLLRHFLELEHPDVLTSADMNAGVDPGLFMEIADTQQRAAALAGRIADAKSPLTLAVLERERVTLRERLQSLTDRVDEATRAAHERIIASEAEPEVLVDELKQLVFLERWAAQLRERELALA